MVRKAHYSLLYQGCLLQLVEGLSIREEDKIAFRVTLSEVQSAADANAFVRVVDTYLSGLR